MDEDDAHLGGFGGRGAVRRVDLDEVLCRKGARPGDLVEHSVDLDALVIGHASGLDRPPCGRAVFRNLRVSAERENRDEDESTEGFREPIFRDRDQ